MSLSTASLSTMPRTVSCGSSCWTCGALQQSMQSLPGCCSSAGCLSQPARTYEVSVEQGAQELFSPGKCPENLAGGEGRVQEQAQPHVGHHLRTVIAERHDCCSALS